MDLLLDIDPELYGPFLTTEKKGKKVLIVKCINAIYLMVVDILIYYNNFLKTFKSTGF